jgi:hypothetical protein
MFLVIKSQECWVCNLEALVLQCCLWGLYNSIGLEIHLPLWSSHRCSPQRLKFGERLWLRLVIASAISISASAWYRFTLMFLGVADPFGTLSPGLNVLTTPHCVNNAQKEPLPRCGCWRRAVGPKTSSSPVINALTDEFSVPPSLKGEGEGQ